MEIFWSYQVVALTVFLKLISGLRRAVEKKYSEDLSVLCETSDMSSEEVG